MRVNCPMAFLNTVDKKMKKRSWQMDKENLLKKCVKCNLNELLKLTLN